MWLFIKVSLVVAQGQKMRHPVRLELACLPV